MTSRDILEAQACRARRESLEKASNDLGRANLLGTLARLNKEPSLQNAGACFDLLRAITSARAHGADRPTPGQRAEKARDNGADAEGRMIGGNARATGQTARCMPMRKRG